MNEKQLKRINEFMKSIEGGAVQPEELEQVFELLVVVIKEQKKEFDNIITSVINELADKISTQKEELSSNVKELSSKISDILKDKDELKNNTIKLKDDFREELENIMSSIPTIPDLKPINEKLVEIENKIPTIKEETPIETRDKLEKLRGDERLDKSAIKGIDEEVKRLDKKIDDKPTGRMGGMRKVPIIKRYNLSSQVDGVTKTFTLPKDTVDIVGVFGTQFPINFNAGTDWTFAGGVLTLTSEVSAPESGQTLYAIIETLFYG